MFLGQRLRLEAGGAGHGLAKLVGKLERLKDPDAIKMAADIDGSTEAVRKAAKKLAAAWTAQITAAEATTAKAEAPKPAKTPRCSADETRDESDMEVQVVREVTRAERDARGRAEAVVIDC